MNPLDRRELLTTFLGAPAAMLLAGCGPRGVVAPIPGELVGADHQLGHQLRRRGELPRPSDGRWTEVDVLVVGAGVAGLSAARRLKRGGLAKLAVVELETDVGGTSRSGRGPSTSYPWGAHYLPAPSSRQTEIVELLSEMSLLEGTDDGGEPLIAEQHLCRDPQERVFYRGRWMEGLYLYEGASAEDLVQLQRFEQLVGHWVDWRDPMQRRALDLPMERSSDDAEVRQLDRISMADLLRKHELTSSRLWWLVEYACRDDYGLTAAQTSAWAGMFYFCARVPAAGADSRPYITWPEGNGRLVRHLRSELQNDVAVSRAIVDLNPRSEDGAEWVDAIALDRDGKAWGYRADRVVFAAPHFVARHVIRPWRDEAPPHVQEFQYGSWMVANVTLSGRPKSNGFPLCWDNVIYDSPSLGYVVATHQSDVEFGPTVLTYYYPLCGDDPRQVRESLLGTGQPEWAEIAVADLSRAHVGFRSMVERVDVMRWGHAMVRPRTGFLFSGARQAAQQPYRGIHFAHSDLSGLPLFEEAFERGNRAADAIIALREGADG